MITFVGASRIKPGSEEKVQEALEAFMPKIRSEPGTLEYIVYRGTEDPNLFIFYERYESPEAQAVHMNSEELKAFMEIAGPCLDCEPIMGNVEVLASAR